MTDAPPLAAIPRCHLIVPCAGVGQRAGTALPKQYHPLAGQPMVMHTLAALAQVPAIVQGLVVLAPDDDFAWPHTGWPAHFARAPVGGASRAESVSNGLDWLLAHGADPQDWVLVHDAARCLVRPQDVQGLIEACASDPVGGLLALPLPDTLKAARDGRVAQTIPREDKWLAQTPQMARLAVLHAALKAAAAQGYAGITDEASALEAQGLRPRLVVGAADNFKITWPADFALAEAVLAARGVHA
ncbi:MAG: 2-C-methyl-D-erythritol 4-phosphate cytidylyltransferase [Limnohabitans sp.]